jgi:hypothetical protein
LLGSVLQGLQLLVEAETNRSEQILRQVIKNAFVITQALNQLI